jgi:hypothetical protein
LVEQGIENPRVGGSIPSSATKTTGFRASNAAQRISKSPQKCGLFCFLAFGSTRLSITKNIDTTPGMPAEPGRSDAGVRRRTLGDQVPATKLPS